MNLSAALIRRTCWALVVSLPPLAVQAANVEELVPDNALAVVMVHNLAAGSAKVEKLAAPFAKLGPGPLPGPLTYAKVVTGLGDGVDENGDAMLIALPGETADGEPRPLFVVPVSDYAKFSASIGGDATGEICRVKVAGEEVIVARRGEYALLMNVEHRPILEGLMAAEMHTPAVLTDLHDWLVENDASFVLLPAGVKLAHLTGQAVIDSEKAEVAGQQTNPALAESFEQARAAMEIYESFVGYLGAEVKAVGTGLIIEESANLRLRARVLPVDGGRLATLMSGAATAAQPLTTFADEQYVIAAGGPMPARSKEQSFSRQFFEKFRTMYGFESFTADDWKLLDEATAAATKGVKSIAGTLLVGEKEDPLYSNVFFTFQVEDSVAYLKSMREGYDKWNEVMERSTKELNKLHYEISEVTIADKPGLCMTTDLTPLFSDPKVAMMAMMLRQMFGPDGKMRTYAIAAGPDLVVTGVANEKGIKKFVERTIGKGPRLADNQHVKTSDALFDPSSVWRMFVSPRGCVDWAERIFKTFAGQFGGATVDFPEYPEGPPVGLSCYATEKHADAEIVWPFATITDLADYIETCTKAP